ncbi:MAG TPA: YciI family protein, partial [Micromonosporaceae bacterium]|nr:YciI family protein [Micromonosporaceae bacterium]
EPIIRDINAVKQEMKDAGAWVFSGGLHPPSTATVIRGGDGGGGDVLLTDGPYLEGKEHIGGFTIVRAPDLDAALAWGRKVSDALRHLLPVEVRPFEDDDD